jgi:glycosyltransferase involved in cell wall biosynthesis
MDLKNQPLVSICLPVYNDEKYIGAAIQSVIDQTYGNWELIITDDCSKDSTPQILKTFTDPRITVVENKKNLGLCGNWNEVVKMAKGEFIKLLPSDDLIAPDCIAKQVEIYMSGKYPSLALVTSYCNLIDSNGKVVMVRKYPFRHGFVKSRSVRSANFFFGTNVIGEPAVGLFKKSVFSQIGYYDEANNYLIDLEFWYRVLLTGDLYVIPETLASFRITQTANTTKVKNKQAKLFMQFAKKIYDDKRFEISKGQYYWAFVVSNMMQRMRKIFMKIFIKG